MASATKQRLLFVVNPGSGTAKGSVTNAIKEFFKELPVQIDIFELTKNCNLEQITRAIKKANPDRVIAVGGDGTLKLVAEALDGQKIPIGIIPTGSANGMAKELNIPLELDNALALSYQGKPKQIHAVKINDHLCIHLADIGFNAYLVKKFDELPERGMLTYAKAAWSAFWNHRKMQVEFTIDGKLIKQKCAMVVIANATKYGTGLEINPDGRLDDELFEVILVKEYAVMEIIKIWISKLPFNPKKIESFQTNALNIKAEHKAHFQVDGEYLGKVNQINAEILVKAIEIIVP